MSKVISFINLKGGVGKTTLLVATAEILAKEHNKKVLVIDLDPQTNATVMLVSQIDMKAREIKDLMRNMILSHLVLL